MIKVWSIPTRLLHWILVASFCVAYYTATSELKRDIHVDAGYIAGVVILVRWCYGFLMKDFSAFRRFPPNPGAGFAYVKGILSGKAKRYLGHNPAGALAIYAMLTIGVLTILTGWLSFNAIEVPFGLIDNDRMQDFHRFVSIAWLWVVGMHLVGVLVGSLVHRENLLRAMITGNKRRRLVDIGRYVPPVPVSREISEALLMQYIEEAAYYIAERKGFQAEHSWEYWLQAEKEVEHMLKNISIKK